MERYRECFVEWVKRGKHTFESASSIYQAKSILRLSCAYLGMVGGIYKSVSGQSLFPMFQGVTMIFIQFGCFPVQVRHILRDLGRNTFHCGLNSSNLGQNGTQGVRSKESGSARVGDCNSTRLPIML